MTGIYFTLSIGHSTDFVAYNERRGKDALGHVAGPALEAGAPQV